MNIDQDIKALEQKIAQLESEDINFETSIALYQNSVKDAKSILERLNQHHETLSVLNIETQELIEMSNVHD